MPLKYVIRDLTTEDTTLRRRRRRLYIIFNVVVFHILKSYENPPQRTKSESASMPNFREARESLLYCYSENLLTDEKFCLLYDWNTSKNPDFDYTCYNKLDLNEMSDDDVVAEFRFMKNDILRLVRALDMPNEITCHFYNDLKVDSMEALCVVLNRLAYPCRYFDMIPRFRRAVPQLSMIFNQTIDFIDGNWGHLLRNMNQPWLFDVICKCNTYEGCCT